MYSDSSNLYPCIVRGWGNILLLGAAILAYKQFSTQAVANRYYAGIRLKIFGVKMQKGVVKVTLIISNPNSQTLTVRSIVGDAFLNGKKVGNVSSFETVKVEGNNSTSIVLNIQLIWLNAIAEWLKMFDKGSGALFQFVGTINVENQAIPVNIKYNVL